MRHFINIVEAAGKGPVMSMGGTLLVLNKMVSDGIIETYAIAGAVAALVYIEPTFTEDVDVLVSLDAHSQSGLINLQPIVSYLHNLGYTEWKHEGLVVEDWIVQFLPVSSALDEDALQHAKTLEVGAIQTRILSAEYLTAKALEVGRLKDYARIEQFLTNNVLDLGVLKGIIERFNLKQRWDTFLLRSGIDDPFRGAL